MGEASVNAPLSVSIPGVLSIILSQQFDVFHPVEGGQWLLNIWQDAWLRDLSLQLYPLTMDFSNSFHGTVSNLISPNFH